MKSLSLSKTSKTLQRREKYYHSGNSYQNNGNIFKDACVKLVPSSVCGKLIREPAVVSKKTSFKRNDPSIRNGKKEAVVYLDHQSLAALHLQQKTISKSFNSASFSTESQPLLSSLQKVVNEELDNCCDKTVSDSNSDIQELDGRKEVAIFLEKKTVESLLIALQNNKPEKEDVAISRCKFLKPEPRNLDHQDMEALDLKQQKTNKCVSTASLAARSQSFLNGLEKVMNEELDKSCKETVPNLDSRVCSTWELDDKKEVVIFLEKKDVESLLMELQNNGSVKEISVSCGKFLKPKQKNLDQDLETLHLQQEKTINDSVTTASLFAESQSLRGLENVMNKELERSFNESVANSDSRKCPSQHLDGKKEVAIFLEQKNVESLLMGLQKNELEKDTVLFSYGKLLTPKRKNVDDQNLGTLQLQQQNTICDSVSLASLLTESQPLYSGLKKVTNEELDMHCHETVPNSDSSRCPTLGLNNSDTFSLNSTVEPLPYLDSVHENEFSFKLLEKNEQASTWNEITRPQLTENRVPTSSHSDGVDLELTPPCSIVSGSNVSDVSAISEDSPAPDFSCLGDLNKQTFTDVSSMCQDTKSINSLQVCIAPFEPSLLQLQHLYQRRNRLKAKRFKKPKYRESHLRPRNTLRKFVPFMITAPPNSVRRRDSFTKKGSLTMDKLCHSEKSKVMKRRVKRGISSQTRLFASSKQKQLKLKLHQKKEALKLRNKFENALDSINKRIFRQNHFWKMLSG